MNLTISSYLKITNDKCSLNGLDFYTFKNDKEHSNIKQLYKFIDLKYPKFYKMDLLSKYGFLASEIIISNNKQLANYNDDEIVMIFANSNSSTSTDLKYLETIEKDKPSPSPSMFVYTLPNILLGEICIKNKWYGENMFFVLESFDSNFLSLYAETLMKENNAKACIVAWVDVSLENKDVFIALIEKSEIGNDSKAIEFTNENLNNKYKQ